MSDTLPNVLQDILMFTAYSVGMGSNLSFIDNKKMKSKCDQTTRLCFQNLAIFSNENLPKSIQIVPK